MSHKYLKVEGLLTCYLIVCLGSSSMKMKKNEQWANDDEWENVIFEEHGEMISKIQHL